MQKRREQRWVSHNKVLIGSGDGNSNKRVHSRNPNFDSEETKLLINLWGNKEIQRTLITIHKKHPVIAKIAEQMRGYGYNRSTEEINTRIKNLKCLYNRIKKDLDSGLLNEPSWKHYQAMDEILSRPVFGNNNNNSSSATNSNKVPVINNKIIISPSSVINGNSQSIQDPNQLVQVKEEELSDGDVAMVHSHDEHTENNVDYEDNELRPEDLLSVVDADEEKSSIQIKEEPVDISTINEKHDEEHIKKVQFDNEKDIVNYPNDSLLSITSVQSNGTQQSNSNIIQIPPNSASSTVASKLSLVPTKLLLKSQANFAATTTSSSITTNAQSSIPMKVVFVNTLNNNAQQAVVQKQQNPQQITLNTHSSPNSTFISNKIITAGQTAAQPTKVHLVNQMPSPNYHSTSATSISNVTSSNNSNGHYRHNSSGISKNKSEKSSSKSLLGSNKLPVIRNLLTNIVEIENQRLEIEKQRFEYEKKVGNELLMLLKTFMSGNDKNQAETSNGI